MRSRSRFSLLLLASAWFTVTALGANQFTTTPTTIEWLRPAEDTGVVLSIQRPDGEVVTQTFAAGSNPLLHLENYADGTYSYELRGTGVEESGSFTVLNGTVVPSDLRERRLPARAGTDTFFTDDVSAQGGVCAGFDCTNAESYGFATIKLKENNLRIKFEDTSVAPFPTTDWQLSANDMSSGGANKFFVEDLTAATVPFLIEGASPNNAIYIDSTGRIGLRTSTPGGDLHINSPSSPTIRMNQNNTMGQPTIVWDIIANHNNFVIRESTAELNPFIIKSGTPYNTIVTDSSARIGLGVASPTFQIHHSSGARLDAGNWTNASSREIKQEIQDLDRDAAFDALRKLEPVTYAYKANPTELQVGFIAEDVPELVATSDHKGLSSMDVVAVLTKVIQEQQKTIDDMKTRLECLEEKN